MHFLSARTQPSNEVVADILRPPVQTEATLQDATVCLLLNEIRESTEILVFQVNWTDYSAAIVQTYKEDEDGVAEGHQYVIRRPVSEAEVRIAVDAIMADVWPSLVASMCF